MSPLCASPHPFPALILLFGWFELDLNEGMRNGILEKARTTAEDAELLFATSPDLLQDALARAATCWVASNSTLVRFLSFSVSLSWNSPSEAGLISAHPISQVFHFFARSRDITTPRDLFLSTALPLFRDFCAALQISETTSLGVRLPLLVSFSPSLLPRSSVHFLHGESWARLSYPQQATQYHLHVVSGGVTTTGVTYYEFYQGPEVNEFLDKKRPFSQLLPVIFSFPRCLLSSR